jgi:branched-chain amino acid transport system ATP-binding protein
VARGLAQSPEGRMVFANLSVMENLEMGAYLRHDKAGIAKDLTYVFSIFPRLKERERQSAGTLSGGEQQMLAIGRALMSKPKCLMLDEPSLGIAPILVRTIFDKIVEVNRELGLTILLVEQNANLALEIAHHGYVLETGRIILDDTAAALRENDEVKAAYLGGE